MNLSSNPLPDQTTALAASRTAKLPAAVTASTILLGLSVVVGFVYLVETRGFGITRVFTISLISFAVFLLLRSLHRGNNITRWAVAILVAIQIATVPYKFSGADTFFTAIFAVQTVLQVAGCALLFLPPSAAWFLREPRRT